VISHVAIVTYLRMSCVVRFGRNWVREQTKKPRCFQRGFSITFNMLHRLRVKDSGVLNLDLNLNTGRKVDALEAVNGLLLGINDVDQTLMDAHLEVLT
jgi:hypothetical protein